MTREESLFLAKKKGIADGGRGILTITDKYMERFNELLLDYDNTGTSDALKAYLYQHSIQGIS